MLYFLKVSFRNLLKATLLTTTTFYVLVLIMGIAIAISNENWSEFFSIQGHMLLFFGAVGIAVMVMLIAFVSEYFEFRMQHNVLQKVPFVSLPAIGFHRTMLFGKTFWKLHKEVYAALIGDYLVVADVPNKKDRDVYLPDNNRTNAFSDWP